VTALAAGHRPCFECRRKEANAFAAYWQNASKLQSRPRADAMDKVLHAERLDSHTKRTHSAKLDTLPNGAMITIKGEPFAVCDRSLLQWSPRGYIARQSRSRDINVNVLTPPSIVAVLKAAYPPHWHKSAAKFTA
jgi:hypothetical protein